jgi:lipoprotein NlpD
MPFIEPNSAKRSSMQRCVGQVALALCVVTLVGCGSSVRNHAPVEDRAGSTSRSTATTDPRTQPVRQMPGFENAGKPGYYVVKPGDNLLRIGLETGQSYKDIYRWNGLENPDKIEVGQVLRVIPPTSGSATPVAAASPSGEAVAKPVTTSTISTNTSPAPSPTAPARTAAASPAATPAPAPTPAPAAAAAVPSGDDDLDWVWPVNGPVLAGFDPVKNKGLDIGGSSGEAVVASADGKVVYAGSGLRGYGNLIILKHNNTFLTAYAHNQTLLVKEDQAVKKGQRIAEMGNTDADRVKLHFEVRRQGKPVDPAKYLPAK